MAAADFLCIAHRGAAGYEPENTLRAIRRALELGAHGIEIDVHAVDGELVVIHDGRLDRTTNGRGPLGRCTLEHLRGLDAGQGERIPLLREVFETVAGRAMINIELKGRGTAGPVAALVEEFAGRTGWGFENFVVSSFRRRELRTIENPQIRIGLLLTRPSRLYQVSARRVRAWSVHPAVPFTSKRFVEDAQRRGLKVIPYTANSAKDIARIRACGADGVFTDFPDRVLGAGGNVEGA